MTSFHGTIAASSLVLGPAGDVTTRSMSSAACGQEWKSHLLDPLGCCEPARMRTGPVGLANCFRARRRFCRGHKAHGQARVMPRALAMFIDEVGLR